MVEEVAADDISHRLIWVESWSELKLPSMGSIDGRDRDLFVLHTLLLHNGLPSRVLAQVLPFPESQIKNILRLLQAAGVVVSDQDIWRVAAKAYPAVREFLRYEGYLVDAL